MNPKTKSMQILDDNPINSKVSQVVTTDEGSVGGVSVYEEEDDDIDWEVNPEAVKKLVEKYQGEEFPLFMGEDVLDPNNPHIQALQALVYDDETPESLARQFRTVGNEYFQDGKVRYKDAIIAYTKGIEQKSADKETNSLLYSNRAHIYLLLKRYVDCVDDCRASLKENPRNVKAAYRGCRASMCMQLYKQALNFALHGLKYEQANPELLKLKSQLDERLSEIERKKKEREELEKRDGRSENEQKRDHIISERGYILGEAIYDVIHTYNHEIKYLQGELVCPILILLDEPMLCEFICEAKESSTLCDHLKVMFPKDRNLPWDTSGRYNWETVSVFYEPGPPHHNIVWEVSIEKSIREILDVVKYIPKIPTLHIIAKNSTFIEEFTKITYNVIRDPLLVC
ncbi:TPR domain-containing protein [Cryptosporidium ubiquitum]|uniref:TPR domain-containing protein n=1 Tax=Cryptosporidium ubiquitum TaxID=857276 RepID=A0A1J4MI47_9CRYT|nr:TPR domain-containing protein [Cryptosporidium ubiquitum]OII73930.1 TPR domain-containing protein [Cryptosporidium ubiquitum]